MLDPRIQRWIWAQGWTSLRSIQQQAIAPLLTGQSDVILAAATSAGKTEAAFFPLLTRLLQNQGQGNGPDEQQNGLNPIDQPSQGSD